MNIKPMLAATLEDSSTLVYPVIASPKLDGIRCLIQNGVALSRSLKPIPNKHVQEWAKIWGDCSVVTLDGELICGEHDATVFNRTTSCVMSKDSEEEFTYWVFDAVNIFEQYAERLRNLRHELDNIQPLGMRLVPTKLCMNEEQLLEFEAECLARGFEGVMVRDPNGPYKFGRSTLKEGTLLKLKRFTDSEAKVIGFEERYHNENELKRDSTGKIDRSTAKAGLKPAGDLGALVCEREDGVIFCIGTGFTAEERVDLWQRRDALIGKLVTFKHFEAGAIDKPRFPVFKAFRDQEDLA